MGLRNPPFTSIYDATRGIASANRRDGDLRLECDMAEIDACYQDRQSTDERDEEDEDRPDYDRLKSRHRDRLLEGDIARAIFEDVVEQARGRQLLSAEPSMAPCWKPGPGLKSFKRKDQPCNPTAVTGIRRRCPLTLRSLGHQTRGLRGLPPVPINASRRSKISRHRVRMVGRLSRS